MGALATLRKMAGNSLVRQGTKGAAITGRHIRVGGSGWDGNMGDWVSSDRPGNIFNSDGGRSYGWSVPFTRINWDIVTGDILSCPAVQACLNYIWRNAPQAPPIIEQNAGEDGWKAAAHPFQDLLSFPNPLCEDLTHQQCEDLSLLVNGNSYSIIEYTEGGDPAELWWVPHSWVSPYTAPDSLNPFAVDYYIVSLGNRRVTVTPDRMAHIRWGRDPLDPRLGLSPWASAARDVNTLQQLGNYRPNALKNNGMASKYIMPDDPNVTMPDPKEIKAKLDSESQGDNVQSTVVLDFMAKVIFGGVSPKDMDTGTFGDVGESNICALVGLPPQVVGLYVARHHKTDASITQQREEAWEGCIMPLNNIKDRQVGRRMLPLYMKPTDREDPVKVRQYLSEWRVARDYSAVRPLQPDLDAINTRELAVYLADGQTFGEFCKNTKRGEPRTDLQDLYYSEIQALIKPAPTVTVTDGQDTTEMTQQGEGGKALTWTESFEKRLGVESWSERVDEEIEARRREKAVAGNGVHS